jgi:hypothetical protein
MSYPQFLPSQPVQNTAMNEQMTPELQQAMQQYQDQQRRQQMVAALMQNNANPQTPNSGLANAGSSILGAVVGRNMQNQTDPQNAVLQQRYGITPGAANGITHPGLMSKLFNLGGGS